MQGQGVECVDRNMILLSIDEKKIVYILMKVIVLQYYLKIKTLGNGTKIIL